MTKTHPYNKHSGIQNFFFHPFHAGKSKAALSILTNIVISVFSLGIWQLPFWLINRRGNKHLQAWKNNLKASFSNSFQHSPSSKTDRVSKTNLSNSSKSLKDKSEIKNANKKNANHSGTNFKHSTSTTNSSSKHSTSTTNSSTDDEEISCSNNPLTLSNLFPLPHGHEDWMDPLPLSLFLFDPSREKDLLASGETITRFDLDCSLLEVSLEKWVSRKNLSSNEQAAMNDPAKQKQVKAIEKKLKDLEHAIQLQKRLKLTGDLVLTAADLLEPWEASPIRFSLVTDDELMVLKGSEIENENIALFLLCGLKRRVKMLAKMAPAPDWSSFNHGYGKDALLIDLCRINASTLRRFIDDLPLITFSLISKKEIPKLQVSFLSQDELNSMLFSSKRMQTLSVAQTNACLDKVNCDLLIFLSTRQIQHLQLSILKKPQFDAIFNVKLSKTKENLQLYGDRIYEICQHFTLNHWALLSDAQIQSFDLAKLPQLIDPRVKAFLIANKAM